MSGCSRSLSIVILFSCLVGGGPLHAGENHATRKPGESAKRFSGEITVTATGEATPAEEVPAAVTVIHRQEMEDALADSVAELLRRVPGLTVMRAGSEGTVTSVFTRGTNSNHTLVLFDGVRLNSPYFAGYDFSQLVTSGLDRVEVVRGPYSALWGADAVGGVINVIPGRAGEGLQAVLFGEGGEDSWARAEATVAWAGGGTDLYLSGFHREGEGGRPNSGFDTDQWLLDLGYSWGDGNRVALVGQDLDATVEIPFSGATVTPHRRQSSRQRVLALPLGLKLGEGWDVELTLSHVTRDFAFRDPDDPWGFTSSDTGADSDGVRLASRHRWGTRTVTWGGEWRGDTVDDVSSFGTNLSGADTSVFSLFLQTEWAVGRSLGVVAGARWDDAEEWGSQLSPRAGVVWRVARGWRLMAAYGEAFRQPSVGELYFPFSGNPNLEAETSRSWEVGLGRERPELGLGWDLSVFRTRLENLIDFDYATSTFQNVSTARISGAELGARVRVARDLTGRLALTWLDTEDHQGLELLRRPRWGGSVTLTGRVTGSLRADLVLRWVGARDDIDPVSFERVRTGGFVTSDLAVSWAVAPHVELTGRVLNLGDRRYQEVLGYPAPRRRVVAGLRWHL